MSQSNDKNKIQQFLVDIKRTKGSDKKILGHLEFILLQNPQLLAETFELVFSLIHVNELQIHLFLSSFIEKICRANPNFILPSLKVILHLAAVQDVKLIKSVITAMTTIYKRALHIMSSFSVQNNDLQQMNGMLISLKNKIIQWAGHQNQGVKIHAFHFIESIVLCFSNPPSEPLQIATRKGTKSTRETIDQSDFDLTMIPQSHPYLKNSSLEAEGEKLISLLATEFKKQESFMAVSTILNCFFTIIKQRTSFWPVIIPLIDHLTSNLTEKFPQSQAISLRFTLRQILMFLLKMPQTFQYRKLLIDSLKKVDIKGEIIEQTVKLVDKALPKKRNIEESTKPSKKVKLETSEDYFPTPWGNKTKEELSEILIEVLKNSPVQKPKTKTSQSVNFNTYASVIMQMMKNQDEESRFYIQNYISQNEEITIDRTRDPRLKMMESKTTNISIEQETKNEEEMKKLINQFKSKVTILSSDQKQDLLKNRWDMVLQDKQLFNQQSILRDSLISRFVVQHSMNSQIFKDLFLFISLNLRKHFSLLIQWLNQEYSTELLNENMIGSNKVDKMDVENDGRYEKIVDSFLKVFKDKLEPNDPLFSRFLVEIPKVTINCYDYIDEYLKDSTRISSGLNSLKELIVERETSRDYCLKRMLESSMSSDENVQLTSIALIQNELFNMDSISEEILSFTVEKLKLFLDQSLTWDSDSARSNILLFFSLCERKTDLIDKFVEVFVKLDEEKKITEEPMKTIITEFQKLVQILGTESSYLLNFLKTFDSNAEKISLIIVQTLVESIKSGSSPSPDFISTVKSIFFDRKKRNAKFLLHLLPLLTTEEIKEALQEIIKLPKEIVKEAFDRILMLGGVSQILSPSQLLIALHEIDANESKTLRTKIMDSINICFENDLICQKNVLSMVIQNLAELNPIPLLAMSTIIKSLQKCEDLSNIVVTVLKRLAQKKVFQSPVVYQGFIKCIQMKELPLDVYESLTLLPTSELIALLKSNSTIKSNFSSYVSNKKINIKNKELKELIQ
eukprot:gene598-8103_t